MTLLSLKQESSGMLRTKQIGMSLMELMIVVVIVGILAAVAYPSYQENMQQSRRSDAQAGLLSFAAAMERYFIQNNSSYTGATAAGVYSATYPLSGTATYNLSIPALSATAYTLRATPIGNGAQAGDGYMEYTSTGIRRHDTNNDGEIGGSEATWD